MFWAGDVQHDLLTQKEVGGYGWSLNEFSGHKQVDSQYTIKKMGGMNQAKPVRNSLYTMNTNN